MNIKRTLFHFFQRHPRIGTMVRNARFRMWRLRQSLGRESPRRSTGQEIVHLDPRSVKAYLGNKMGHRFATRGMIEDGDWDVSKPHRLEGLPAVRAIHAKIQHGSEWSDSDYFRVVDESIKTNGTYHGAVNPTDFFQRLDRLIISIRENGLVREQDVPPAQRQHWDSQGDFQELDDITVGIDRNGHFLLQDGKHRLAIAQALCLKSIPVAVGLRHAKWEIFRDEVLSFCDRRGGKAYQAFAHPDLQDFKVHHDDDRVERIASALDGQSGTMLDIGAYFGYFCTYFGQRGWKCTAVEHHSRHMYFLRRLAAASAVCVDTIDGSFLEMSEQRPFDVVLALNIFHHYFKTQSLVTQLKHFIQHLQCHTMFLETHVQSDEIMRGAHWNPSPLEFAETISDWCGLSVIEPLGETTRGRALFVLRGRG